ncbi:LacI family DNA-binding transcriptional regulator [Pseudidiomarina terrestris]|uniref:LacI family DNA-binding transcriptional regulator n=1 Tax=Pseudidiomarina terrestris TaxID=2820060 RepID=A0AAW7QZ52_9GAMM|nr:MULTISPECIES: LacI family DNA-binding transcriptional regulator [unclassified Pseudidiomarina]MDN7124155.1 LacI family DNA-binding transcriptional regulator [Pseudidiomarina sp. 1APP75-32.1]MDN7127222.1 LacI family DNA-binding transcriptional regulator [Pseudidiomarina sp. 1APR75-33.1]MDN7128412.1 LacI family DNA-binding transcriptional regulator [Pseudidiomarina sp. 1APR75-15]MDN7135340.1 LacI family DNA-binding transcriptional regulator [Pseudidiomarina sp. 1ASP75-5]
MATIYEVSKLAGVSLATVSRVINNTAQVREATRVKVEAAMQELGYRPNSVAQSLASNRSNSIGILVSELSGPFYGELLARIEEEFRTVGKHVIIAAGHSDAELERESIEFLRSRNCDALILHVESVSDNYLRGLADGGCDFVLINRYVRAIADRCITLDNRQGGYLATHHMLELGHRDIAYVSGPMWKNDAKERYAGHLEALAEFGVAENKTLFFEGDFQETGGVRGLQHLLGTDVPFSALVCANDEMASGAITAAHDIPLDLPQQLSVIGFDNVNFAHYTYPKLTTVDYPIAEIGQMAARWVLKNVYHQPVKELQDVFEPRVIERDSTQKI